jgi:hypothetical protein
VSPDETCAVCGRTILAGEQVRGYVSSEGHRSVCELCQERAEGLGWRWEKEADDSVSGPPEKRRGTGLSRLWRSSKRSRSQPPPDPPPAPTAPNPDPAAAGARVERLQTDASPLSPFEQAAARFNASDAGHTVTGLTRTLGTPWVSVGASAGTPREVRITVAWELSWYQWGVDLGDELRPVFELGKGGEIDQIDAAARQWNASAVEGGRIVLVAPGRRPANDGASAGR